MKGLRNPPFPLPSTVRSILYLLIFLASALLLSACGGGSSEAAKHYNSGEQLQLQGSLEEAITEYDEAIRLDPKLAVAYKQSGPRLQ